MKKQYVKPSAALFSVCGRTDVLDGFNKGLAKYSIDTCANEWFGKERNDFSDDSLPVGNTTTNGTNGVEWDF